jgi:hypothetical protein
MDKPRIGELIWQLIKDKVPGTAFTATVTAVQEADNTVTVKANVTEIEYEGVSLRGVDSSSPDAMVVYPAVGSVVLVASKNNVPADLYVVAITEAAKVKLRGDSLGGMVKVVDLVEKLNNLENKVNSIQTAYNLHVHPDPASGLTGVPTVALTGTLTPTNRAMLENELVQHG